MEAIVIKAVARELEHGLPARVHAVLQPAPRDIVLVLRSGADGEQGRWFDERRDLRADFRQAFPHEAAAGLPRITALAFATDADNTRSRASAWFGDMALEAR